MTLHLGRPHHSAVGLHELFLSAPAKLQAERGQTPSERAAHMAFRPGCHMAQRGILTAPEPGSRAAEVVFVDSVRS